MSKHDAAIKLAVQGFKVFPLLENTKDQPLVKDWENVASDDLDAITSWWTSSPNANIAIATGRSKLLVLDFDSAKDPNETSGIENFRQAYKRKLTDTYTVATASGGWHLYYMVGTATLRNTASRLAKKVDTRAQGGYVVAPGSIINGNAYTTRSTMLPQPAPPWVVQELLKETKVTRSDNLPKGDTTAYALAALRGEANGVREQSEGGRNHATNRAAWNVSRFVAKGELDYETARATIIEAAEQAGLSKREASHATASGLQRGIKYYGDKA